MNSLVLELISLTTIAIHKYNYTPPAINQNPIELTSLLSNYPSRRSIIRPNKATSFRKKKKKITFAELFHHVIREKCSLYMYNLKRFFMVYHARAG